MAQLPDGWWLKIEATYRGGHRWTVGANGMPDRHSVEPIPSEREAYRQAKAALRAAKRGESE